MFKYAHHYSAQSLWVTNVAREHGCRKWHSCLRPMNMGSVMDPNCIMDRLLSKSQHTRTCIILQFLEIGHLVSWSEGCVLGLICNLTCIVLWPHMPVILCTRYVFWVPSPTVSLIIVKKTKQFKASCKVVCGYITQLKYQKGDIKLAAHLHVVNVLMTRTPNVTFDIDRVNWRHRISHHFAILWVYNT